MYIYIYISIYIYDKIIFDNFFKLLGHFWDTRGPKTAKIEVKSLAHVVIDRLVNYPPLAVAFGLFFGPSSM